MTVHVCVCSDIDLGWFYKVFISVPLVSYEQLTMEGSSSKDSSVASSPFSSPNVSALLKIKIISW